MLQIETYNKAIGQIIRTILNKGPELISINVGSKDGFIIAQESKEKIFTSLSLTHQLPYSLTSKEFISASNSAILDIASKLYKEMLKQESYYSIAIGDIGALSVCGEHVAIIGLIQEHSSNTFNFLNIAGQIQTLQRCIERHKQKNKKIKKGILKSIKESIPVISALALISKENGLPIKTRPKIDLDLFCFKINWLMNTSAKIVGNIKYLIISGISGHIIINNSDEERMTVLVIPPLSMDEYFSKTDAIASYFKAIANNFDEFLSSLT
ncbi:MAG: hypothetical protein ACFFDN_26690 [Candidatus Hodarchaeota archaeon]